MRGVLHQVEILCMFYGMIIVMETMRYITNALLMGVQAGELILGLQVTPRIRGFLQYQYQGILFMLYGLTSVMGIVRYITNAQVMEVQAGGLIHG